MCSSDLRAISLSPPSGALPTHVGRAPLSYRHAGRLTCRRPQDVCATRTPKSPLVRVDIGRRHGYCFSRRHGQARPAGHEPAGFGARTEEQTPSGSPGPMLSVRVPQDPGLDGGPRSRSRDPRTPPVTGPGSGNRRSAQHEGRQMVLNSLRGPGAVRHRGPSTRCTTR